MNRMGGLARSASQEMFDDDNETINNGGGIIGQSILQVNPEDLEDSETDDLPKPEKRAGRRKIKIEYIEDKSRRHITFSKRKAGIMKKAYELSTLTGTQVLLLVASETGHVYTFATPKLQPLITKPEGKNLIQACLNSPDNATDMRSNSHYSESTDLADYEDERKLPVAGQHASQASYYKQYGSYPTNAAALHSPSQSTTSTQYYNSTAAYPAGYSADSTQSQLNQFMSNYSQYNQNYAAQSLYHAQNQYWQPKPEADTEN